MGHPRLALLVPSGLAPLACVSDTVCKSARSCFLPHCQADVTCPQDLQSVAPTRAVNTRGPARGPRNKPSPARSSTSKTGNPTDQQQGIARSVQRIGFITNLDHVRPNRRSSISLTYSARHRWRGRMVDWPEWGSPPSRRSSAFISSPRNPTSRTDLIRDRPHGAGSPRSRPAVCLLHFGSASFHRGYQPPFAGATFAQGSRAFHARDDRATAKGFDPQFPKRASAFATFKAAAQHGQEPTDPRFGGSKACACDPTRFPHLAVRLFIRSRRSCAAGWSNNHHARRPFVRLM